MKKLKALLLSLFAVSLIGGVAACDNSSEDSSPNNSVVTPTPEDSTPGDSTPEDPTPAPSVFDGIAFSDAATVIPAAYELAQGATLEGTYTLKGKIISSDGYNSKYGDISVTIAVEGYEEYPIYCYQIKKDADKITLGDIIAVTGTIKNYKGKVEFDRPELLAWEEGTLAPAIDVTPSAGTGLAEGYQVITVEQALAIATVQEGEPTERYYIHATVSSVTNAQYGEMVIEDATGSISVYGTYSADGSIGYAAMDEKPLKGADVLLHCTLNTFSGAPQVKNARLIAFENTTLDDSNYQEMSIEDAREAAKGTKIKVDGVVAQITYASGMVPNGFYLVDNTNSIYVYDSDVAATVAKGNTVTILAEKDWWILEDEQASADKFGYQGCNQLTNAWLFENDNGNNEPDYSWVETSTVKEIIETPFTTDITTTIYKVTGLVSKSVGSGFINYYINDLDGVTGSYIYTQANGGDLGWLEEFDGKICTVYLSAINAKSTSSGCNWRFKALKVVDEGFVFDVNANATQFAIDYHAVGQFKTKYTANPALEVIPSVSSALLKFENVALSYESSNTDVITFTTEEGKTVMNCVGAGTANITITATLAGATTASKTISITFEPAQEISSITVAEAITTALNTEITVKGIVGPSVVNQKSGFYLFGEDGSMIAVRLTEATMLAEIEIGHEIIIKGTRNRKFNETKTEFGQSDIYNAVVLQNNYGNHAYSTAKFTEATIDALAGVDVTADYTTNGYIVSCKVSVGSNAVILQGEKESITLYASGVAAYSWVSSYAKDQVVTLEIALCNWNAKGYKACVLAICLEDGTKILNTTNFDAN